MVGRPVLFKTASPLEKACENYFKTCDENPWFRNELVKGGDFAGSIVPVPTARPYTLIALCQHIGMTRETWYQYEKKPGFSDITTYVRDKIYNQKFEGAAVGAFNANLIARELGLSERQDINVHVEKPILEDLTKSKVKVSDIRIDDK